jgi:hypothetical protein
MSARARAAPHRRPTFAIIHKVTFQTLHYNNNNYYNKQTNILLVECRQLLRHRVRSSAARRRSVDAPRPALPGALDRAAPVVQCHACLSIIQREREREREREKVPKLARFDLATAGKAQHKPKH